MKMPFSLDCLQNVGIICTNPRISSEKGYAVRKAHQMSCANPILLSQWKTNQFFQVYK